MRVSKIDDCNQYKDYSYSSFYSVHDIWNASRFICLLQKNPEELRTVLTGHWTSATERHINKLDLTRNNLIGFKVKQDE